MEGKIILIIDDDPTLLGIAELIFSRAGGQVYTATSGQEGLCQFYAHRPDLVLLDVMMPDMDGWQVCERIRQLSDVPIIMLTALGQDDDIMRGLDCGADDYVTKPFSLKVLAARARAILRRAALPSVTEKPATYSNGYLTIDLGQRQVVVRGEPLKLTPTEYRLLAYLLRNAGRVLTFQQILESVWGWEYQGNAEYVHVYTSRLRQKLEEDPKNPQYLLTEHGVGYSFRKLPAVEAA
jgi:two-component system KDP operon response regulator KdpE